MPKVTTALQVAAALPDPDVIEGELIETALVPVSPETGVRPALQQEMSLARIFAASGIFADSQKAAQAAVKIIAGQDLGIPPTAAMTGIYLVKGRLTLSANLLAALVRRSPHYDYRVKTLTNTACEITFFHAGTDCGASVFTLEDARLAGVAGGDNWKKYPRNMLFARALSNGVRWFCPDLCLGPVYTPDEIGSDLATASAAAADWLPDPDA